MLSGGKIGAINNTQPNLPEVASDGDFVTTDTTLRDMVLRSLYYEADISPEYLRRLKRIVTKLKVNGVDIERIGTIKYTARFKPPFQLGAEASVDRTNTIFMNNVGGFEDWLSELMLAHEYQHLVQNNEAWNRIARSKGLNPQEYTLKQAMIEKRVPRHFKKAVEEYFEWDQNLSEAEEFFGELEAYLFMYDYYANHVKEEIDLCRRNFFEDIFYYALNNFLSLAYKTSAYNEPINKQMLEKAEEIQSKYLSNCQKRRTISDRDHLQETGNQCRSYFQHLLSRASGELVFTNGSSYSLRERLVELHAIETLSPMLKIFTTGLDADLRSDDLEHLTDKIAVGANARLNRQTLGYGYLPWRGTSHRLYYRNDTQRFLDGFIRAQHVAEIDLDSDKNTTLRVGHDIGIYFSFTEHLFLKAAPLVYLGYQAEQKNAVIGGRSDVGLHYDIDLTQRLGLSLAVGYSVGAQSGTKEDDVYHQIGFTSELFRY